MLISSKPVVLMTHQLPEDRMRPIIRVCNLYCGPIDAIELDLKLIGLLPKAEGIYSLLTIPISEKILDRAPNLRVVSNMAVGVDNIDVRACTKRGIPVGNTPGVLTDSTADLSMALILSAARNLPDAS